MSHPLDGCRLKIERANEHITQFETEVDAFLSTNPYTVEGKADPQSGDITFFIRVHQDQPARLGTIVGDAVHNLRSALDHLMWQLVLANGRTPNSATAFPVVWDPKVPTNPVEYERRFLGKVRGASNLAIALIDAMQPYHVVDFGLAPKTDPLALLHSLDIRDKHQTLHVVGGAAVSKEIVLARADKTYEFKLITGIEDAISPLKDRTPLFTIPFEAVRGLAGLDMAEPNVKSEVTFTEVIEEAFPSTEIVAMQALITMRRVVEHSLGHFASFFS